MYELRQLGPNTYYMDCPSRVGFYEYMPGKVCCIDSGNDRGAGRKVEKILQAKEWELTAIYNTHSHADHVGGNAILQERTGCKIYAPPTEAAFINFPQLEPAFLFGGCPHKGLRNKFFEAAPSQCQIISPEVLVPGLSMVRLDGHAGTQCAFHTADDVWFLGDSVVAQETLEKYHISYIYNVAGFYESLDIVEQLEGAVFLPAHDAPTENIRPLVEKNRQNALQLEELLVKLLETPMGFDKLVQAVFQTYDMTLSIMQHALIGATLRSFLSYLTDKKVIHPVIVDNIMVWALVSETTD